MTTSSKTITDQVERFKTMQDGLLGSVLVRTLKENTPDEYKSLMDFFMARPEFVASLEKMVEACHSEEFWAVVKAHA